MTSLSAQLSALKQSSAFNTLQQQSTLLFDKKKAASIDDADVYALGLNGFLELTRHEPRFTRFEEPLFSDRAKSLDVFSLGPEQKEEMLSVLCEFLVQLSPYALLKASSKALEWLVRKFKIHKFCSEKLILCVLPYHESALFGKVLELIELTYILMSFDNRF